MICASTGYSHVQKAIVVLYNSKYNRIHILFIHYTCTTFSLCIYNKMLYILVFNVAPPYIRMRPAINTYQSSMLCVPSIYRYYFFIAVYPPFQ